jgi:hypothetical protein
LVSLWVKKFTTHIKMESVTFVSFKKHKPTLIRTMYHARVLEYLELRMHEKRLKIPEGQSEVVNRRKTDNTMGK